MAKRASLAGNVAKPDPKKAAEVAAKLTGKPAPPEMVSPDQAEEIEYETVSYNLPLDLIDLVRDLAAARHAKDQAEKRQLRRDIKAGRVRDVPKPPQARKSASAIIRECIEARRAEIEAELKDLG